MKHLKILILVSLMMPKLITEDSLSMTDTKYRRILELEQRKQRIRERRIWIGQQRLYRLELKRNYYGY